MKRIYLFILCALSIPISLSATGLSAIAASTVKTTLLIKIPTRSRPHQFFKNLDFFYQNLSFQVPYHFLITCDSDDESMNNPAVIKRLNCYPNLTYTFSSNKTKIDAFNEGLADHEFDMVLIAHDDMQPIVRHFDRTILGTMEREFPDFDGVLNFHDGFVGEQCNTYPVIGHAFYKRFGYIYNPVYISEVANVELTNISKMLKKEFASDIALIKHNHPAWNAGKSDDLYTKNSKYHARDAKTFLRRRTDSFDLSPETLIAATPRLWSILICTIEGREESFDRLCTKLKEQINALGLCDHIEILSYKDVRGEHSVGFKRNKLLAASSGQYTQFLDDDDDIHENFIQMIYEKLQTKPDCVSLTGIITFNGAHPKTFIHSIQYDHYFEENNTYYRPPNHINAIKHSIAVQFSFPEKNVGEDTDWAMAIARSELIKTEAVIETPYYFYHYDDTK